MRTHYCGQLNAALDGQIVTLCGWAHRRRDHGGVIFIALRDREGMAQIVIDPDTKEAFAAAETVRNEFVLKVVCKVRARPDSTVNPNIPTGEVEMLATDVENQKPEDTVVEEPTYTEPGKELLGSMFAKTLESLELRKLRSHVLTLSLDECVTYVKSDTRWAGLMVSLMTSARAEKLMARLSPEERKKVVAQTFDIDPAVAVKKADEITKSFDFFLHNYTFLHQFQLVLFYRPDIHILFS